MIGGVQIAWAPPESPRVEGDDHAAVPGLFGAVQEAGGQLFVGRCVELKQPWGVPGVRGHTARRGTVRQVIWHHKDGCFHYYIEEAGKRVSKRYRAEDLEADGPQDRDTSA